MKTPLKIAAGIMFAGTLLLNVSFDSTGHFSLFKKAKAETGSWLPYDGTCPNGTVIHVCGAGSTTCTPSGKC